MNNKLTTKHLIVSMVLDYMLSTGHSSSLMYSESEVNMYVLKDMMIKESEFPIYTPTNVLFLTIILGMMNNQVSMLNYLNNISRDLESTYWMAIISKVLEIRSFGEENTSTNKNFKIFSTSEMCQKYPEFRSLVHSYIKEELFQEYKEVQIMYSRLTYSSHDIEGGEKKLITHWTEGTLKTQYLLSGSTGFELETYQRKRSRILSLPFILEKDVLSQNTIQFLLYSLSFHFTDVPWSWFNQLNNNYDV